MSYWPLKENLIEDEEYWGTIQEVANNGSIKIAIQVCLITYINMKKMQNILSSYSFCFLKLPCIQSLFGGFLY